ncbi:VOC family protein [Humitalea sp. 24SJ18S-53]|uniref:VOC family protein n=1 Tax=Humitalea sp. 24SJ18S-53 TaxID=3422307 RepID=UPI003D671A0F
MRADIPVRAFHHVAYRCRDSEETRRFYEDFIGLELAEAFLIEKTKTGREASVLHTFYRLADGSFLAFFEVPNSPFDFKEQHDFDLHVAMEVAADQLEPMLAKGRAAGIETRGPSDHGVMRSIYFRDPNGYVVELAAKTAGHDTAMDPARNAARARLDGWQKRKPGLHAA